MEEMPPPQWTEQIYDEDSRMSLVIQIKLLLF